MPDWILNPIRDYPIAVSKSVQYHKKMRFIVADATWYDRYALDRNCIKIYKMRRNTPLAFKRTSYCSAVLVWAQMCMSYGTGFTICKCSSECLSRLQDTTNDSPIGVGFCIQHMHNDGLAQDRCLARDHGKHSFIVSIPHIYIFLTRLAVIIAVNKIDI